MLHVRQLSMMEQVAGSQQAATRIQTAARGLLDRMHAARAAEQELLFLNMKWQVWGLFPEALRPCCVSIFLAARCSSIRLCTGDSQQDTTVSSSTNQARQTEIWPGSGIGAPTCGRCMQRPAVGARKDQRERIMSDRERLVIAQREADAAYQAALVTEKAEVALLEGPGMREEIQGKVRVWYCHEALWRQVHIELKATGGTLSL